MRGWAPNPLNSLELQRQINELEISRRIVFSPKRKCVRRGRWHEGATKSETNPARPDKTGDGWRETAEQKKIVPNSSNALFLPRLFLPRPVSPFLRVHKNFRSVFSPRVSTSSEITQTLRYAEKTNGSLIQSRYSGWYFLINLADKFALFDGNFSKLL